MASRAVGGLLLPEKVAYHPALELCNTKAWWGSQTPKEYLLTGNHVRVLADDLALPHVKNAVSSEPAEDEAHLLARVIDLRADLYAVVTEIAADWRVSRLDAAIRAGQRDLEFHGLRNGTPVWRPRSIGSTGVIHGFARAAADLLERPRRIGACPRCGWVYLDPSGRRKWCSMKWCGNREKVHQYAMRAKSAESNGKP